MDDALADLQRRYAFQEDLIQKLDAALREQDRRIERLGRRVDLLAAQLSTLQPAEELGDEPPPPHY